MRTNLWVHHPKVCPFSCCISRMTSQRGEITRQKTDLQQAPLSLPTEDVLLEINVNPFYFKGSEPQHTVVFNRVRLVTVETHQHGRYLLPLTAIELDAGQQDLPVHGCSAHVDKWNISLYREATDRLAHPGTIKINGPRTSV